MKARATLLLAGALVLASATRARADDGEGSEHARIAEFSFGVDLRYLSGAAPSIPLQTHYPFAAKVGEVPGQDGLNGVGGGLDLRWRGRGGFGVPILGASIAILQGGRSAAAPDGATLTSGGTFWYGFGLPGVSYYVPARGWLFEAQARPTLSVFASRELVVGGERGRFEGSATTLLRVGGHAEIDVCPPAISSPRIRVCAFGGADAAILGGQALAFGLRFESGG